MWTCRRGRCWRSIQLWNQVWRAVDAAAAPGQFLLTGSAVPADDAARHTGAGRFSFVRLRPMTLAEAGMAPGGLSLASLFGGNPPQCSDPGLRVPDLAELICRGGWPGQRTSPVMAACRAARDYLEQVRQVDVQRLEQRRRDPQRLGAVLRALARSVATEVSLNTLAADAGGGDGPIDPRTVADQLQALEHQLAWRPHLRSKAARATAIAAPMASACCRWGHWGCDGWATGDAGIRSVGAGAGWPRFAIR